MPDANQVEAPALRCSQCVLPRSVPGLFRNGGDVCNVCLRAPSPADAPEAGNGKESIDEVIEDIRESGHQRQFDCVVGLSGGRDSTYLAHLLVRKHRLRCLAAYYRTPFTPDVTDQNVKNTAQRLGIPLVEIRSISQRYHRDVARKFCLLWKQYPLPEVANLSCGPCKLLNAELLRTARRYGVRSLVLAGNKFEEIQFLPTFQDGDLDTQAHSIWRQSRKLARIAGKGLRLLTKCPSVLGELPLCLRASLLYLTPFSAYLQLAYPEVMRVDYFFHTPWVEQEVVGTIQSELGWRLPPDGIGTWKADCEYAEIKNYMFHRMYGATYLDGMLSNMVRAGQLSREQAMARIDGKPMFSRERLRRALATLGLPNDFVDGALADRIRA
jgi:hypothetical protein